MQMKIFSELVCHCFLQPSIWCGPFGRVLFCFCMRWRLAIHSQSVRLARCFCRWLGLVYLEILLLWYHSGGTDYEGRTQTVFVFWLFNFATTGDGSKYCLDLSLCMIQWTRTASITVQKPFRILCFIVKLWVAVIDSWNVIVNLVYAILARRTEIQRV